MQGCLRHVLRPHTHAPGVRACARVHPPHPLSPHGPTPTQAWGRGTTATAPAAPPSWSTRARPATPSPPCLPPAPARAAARAPWQWRAACPRTSAGTCRWCVVGATALCPHSHTRTHTRTRMSVVVVLAQRCLRRGRGAPATHRRRPRARTPQGSSVPVNIPSGMGGKGRGGAGGLLQGAAGQQDARWAHTHAHACAHTRLLCVWFWVRPCLPPCARAHGRMTAC